LSGTPRARIARRRPATSWIAALAIVAALAGCDRRGVDPPRPKPSGAAVAVQGGTATPYGRGAGRVWVLVPAGGHVESVVVYLHGWGANLPFEWHQAWLEHLLARGNAVLFPEYQDGVDDAFVVAPYDLRDGLKLGFRALREDDVPVVAAGFSVGASLAFVYAELAERWSVPRPRAVYSIFPVDPLLIDPSLDVSGLGDARILLLVGDRDDVVGRGGANAFWSMLTAVPPGRKEYRVIRTTDHLFATHEAPTVVDDPVVRQTFWGPLDLLVGAARRESDG
jgi:acetyl esterase/lipase